MDMIPNSLETLGGNTSKEQSAGENKQGSMPDPFLTLLPSFPRFQIHSPDWVWCLDTNSGHQALQVSVLG